MKGSCALARKKQRSVCFFLELLAPPFRERKGGKLPKEKEACNRKNSLIKFINQNYLKTFIIDFDESTNSTCPKSSLSKDRRYLRRHEKGPAAIAHCCFPVGFYRGAGTGHYTRLYDAGMVAAPHHHALPLGALHPSRQGPKNGMERSLENLSHRHHPGLALGLFLCQHQTRQCYHCTYLSFYHRLAGSLDRAAHLKKAVRCLRDLPGAFCHIQFSTGIIIGLLSSLLTVLVSVLNKGIVDKHNPENITLYQLTGGFLGLTILLPLFQLFFPEKWVAPTAWDWVWLVVLSWLCTILTFFLYIRALKKVSAFTVNLTLTLEPLYGIILAFLLYQENKLFSQWFYVGFALIALAVVLHMWRLLRPGK